MATSRLNGVRLVRRWRLALLGVVLAAGAVLTAFPFFWMVATSLKPLGESRLYPPTIVPSSVTIESYLSLFTDLDFGTYLRQHDRRRR